MLTTAILDCVDPATAGATGLPGLLAPLRADPASTAILCDVDGTLAPIVDDPGAATVPPRTRDLLEILAGRYALVACLTGRRALLAREMVGAEGVVYAGNHGFEVLEPGEVAAVAAPAVGARAALSAEFVAALDGDRLAAVGLRVEDKGPIQALHWRGAEPEEPARLRAEEIASQAERDGLVPRWGRKVLELRPVAGIDKGSAAAGLVRRVDARQALFGGDDRTDLDAFAALRELRGSGGLRVAVCVGVASDEAPEGLAEAVDAIVDGPEGFMGVLEALAE